MADVFTPSDTLMDQGRIYRPRLVDWARDLTANLEAKIDLDDLNSVGERAGHLNASALVLALAGRSDPARQLCQAQCRWLLRSLPGLPREEVGVFALQPVVNLGRLARQRGDVESAVLLFSSIWSADSGGNLSMLGDKLTQTEWLKKVAEPLYAGEVAKTLLTSGRRTEGLKFIQEVYAAGSEVMLFEVEVQLLLSIGDYHRCWRVLERDRWNEKIQWRLARLFYRGVVLRRIGEYRNALLVVESLLSYLQQFVGSCHARPMDHNIFRMLLETGRLCEELGVSQGLKTCVDMAYELGIRSLDIPLSAGFAEIVYKNYDNAHEVTQRPVDILRDSGYVGLARKYGSRAELSGEVLDRINRLEEIAAGSCALDNSGGLGVGERIAVGPVAPL